MKSMAAAEVSSSIVSMRFLVSAPVSSMVCLPILPKRGSTVGSSRVGRLAPEDAARPELGPVRRVLRIVRQFRLFLGVEVIEVAEEFIEAVHGRQRFIAIADVVLAELPGGIAEVLEQAADGRIELAHAHRSAREADLGKPGANAVLTGEERRAAGGAGLLAVIVQERDALAADAIDIRRLVAHEAVGVGADVRDTDIVAEDDEDVRTPTGGLHRSRRRLLRLRRGSEAGWAQRRRGHQQGGAQQHVAPLQSGAVLH